MVAPQNGFNVVSVERLTGVTHRQLVHWDKTGLVRPSVRSAAGRGTRRLYSFEDLVELRVVAALRAAGVSLQALRKAIVYLRKHHARLLRPLANLTFITDGNRVFTVADDPAVLLDATAGGQLVFTVVALGRIVTNLRDKLSEISAPREMKVRVRNGATYRAILTPDLEVGGYGIEFPELPGCFSMANSTAEARAMAIEAIECHLGLAGRAASTSDRVAHG